MPKYTKEKFVNYAKLKHGDKYKYDKVVYVDSRTKVDIICPNHGVFKQEPSAHLRGQGCPKCRKSHKIDKNEFVQRSTIKHGNKYDYSLTEYVNSQTKVKIVCPLHGVFEMTPASHISGQGCPKCKADKTRKRFRKAQTTFIEQAISVHGHKYNYSKVEYKNTHSKVCIICNECGREFWQTPHNHIDGQSCPWCLGRKKTTEIFKDELRNIYGDKYNIDNVVYVNAHTPVKLVCSKHGTFEKKPKELLKGYGCVACGIELTAKKLSEQKTYTQEQFIEQSIKAHGYRYDYSQSKYINNRHEIFVICPDHGGFWQNAGEHMCGTGCPMCNRRKGEDKVARYLKEKNINFIEQYRINNDNLLSINKLFVVDFFLPNHNIIIEYNGKQHYAPIDYFGGKKKFEQQQDRDESLRFYCEKHKIKLIEIPYTDFDKIEEILVKEIKRGKGFKK